MLFDEIHLPRSRYIYTLDGKYTGTSVGGTREFNIFHKSTQKQWQTDGFCDMYVLVGVYVGSIHVPLIILYLGTGGLEQHGKFNIAHSISWDPRRSQMAVSDRVNR